jgi:protoporphyrinogen IX oxidase
MSLTVIQSIAHVLMTSWDDVGASVDITIQTDLSLLSRGPTTTTSFLSFLNIIEERHGQEHDMIGEYLAVAYPWTKSLHVISVIAWMAGLFYLPRLFVYHAESVTAASDTDALFQTMEYRLLRAIMNPAMIATWAFGLALVFTPGVVYWGDFWPWAKAGAVLAMTWFHHWLALRRKDFSKGKNTRTGRTFRIMNEVPTLLLIIIVISVIARPFS